MVSVVVLIVFDGVCGCLDGIWWWRGVSGLCMMVSVGVWIMSDGVCVCLDGIW